MNRLKMSVLFLFAAISIAAVGSAALSSINFERSVSAGQVLVDTDANVAIQVTNISNYTNLVKTEADGKVKFDLNEAINNSSSGGFNTDAIYTIGSATSGVVKIKNNSDIPVTVTMTSDSSSTNAISLKPAGNSGSTIPVGSSSDFYFTVNTNGQDALKTLNAVIRVEGK